MEEIRRRKLKKILIKEKSRVRGEEGDRREKRRR